MPDIEITPTPAEEGDLGLESADDILRLTDAQLGQALNLTEKEPEAEVVAEVVEPETVTESVAEAPVTEPVAETAAEPEVKPEVKPPAKRIADFTAFDKEGELEIPDDVTLTYTANGKLRENVPIDKVVRMAQMGEYNSEREENVRAADEKVARAEQEKQAIHEEVQNLNRFFVRVLQGDDEFLEAARQNYAQQNSPEARAQRAEARLAESESRQQAESESRHAAAFIHTQLAPRLTQLIEADYPSLSFEEVMGRFNIVTAPLLVRGVLPLQSLPKALRLVEDGVVPWARHVHETRQLDKTISDNKVAEAQTKATLAKRQLARATQPAAARPPAAPPPNPNESADEWLDRTLPPPRPA